MKLNKIVIAGMGLIGGSIGKTLLSRGLCREVAGIFRKGSSLERALGEGALSRGYLNDYEGALKGADIVFIATPLDAAKDVMASVYKAARGDKILVTDVGSTKRDIVEHASALKDRISFVGGHPLAGSEKTGVEHSSPELFNNSLCILTETPDTVKESLEIVKKIWEEIGAAVIIVDPPKHDHILAVTSHLPHIAAYALAGSLEEDFMRFTATGFKDTTRIASSDPGIWTDIFLANRDNVLKAIDIYKGKIGAVEMAIRNKDRVALENILSECKGVRDGIA